MPRQKLDLPAVECLSILGMDGRADPALEPEIPPEDLRRLYRTFLLARRFDERMLSLQRQGRIGTYLLGDCQEALNFAGVFQVPLVFVCVNNQWAISVPRTRQTRARSIAQKAVAYGFPGVQVDGNDLLAVYAATREAVDRARAGGGPTLVEAVTYRLLGHSTADDPSKYRADAEVKDWEAKEPLPRFRRHAARRRAPRVPRGLDAVRTPLDGLTPAGSPAGGGCPPGTPRRPRR